MMYDSVQICHTNCHTGDISIKREFYDSFYQLQILVTGNSFNCMIPIKASNL